MPPTSRSKTEPFKPKRTFSLEEANRALPLVRRILDDVVKAHEQLLLERERSAALKASTPAARVAQERVEALEEDLNGYMAEMDQIGCLCKDPARGLVDFPALREGRIVFLCWKLGEREVSHWHEVEAGFAGRHPVLEE